MGRDYLRVAATMHVSSHEELQIFLSRVRTVIKPILRGEYFRGIYWRFHLISRIAAFRECEAYTDHKLCLNAKLLLSVP